MLKRSILVVAALLFTCSGQGRAGVITFDDISNAGGGVPISNGYGGFNWNNFDALNGDTFGPSGYQNGTVSHPNVAFNAFGNPASFSSSTPFDFIGADLTAAWNDGLKIDVQGFLNGNLVDDVTVTVNTSGPTFFNFNFDNVDTVKFTSSGGTNHGYNGNGTHFALDNLTFSVPEPTTFALFGMIAVGAGYYGWRRRKAA
jgi:hypothetical protein